MPPARHCLFLALGGAVIPYVSHVIATAFFREQPDFSIDYNLGSAFWLAAPFLAVSVILFLLGRVLPVRRNKGLAFGALFALTGWYLFGHFGSEHALLNHHWTAAALSIALLPLTCLPALCVGLVLGWFLIRYLSPSEASPSGSMPSS